MFHHLFKWHKTKPTASICMLPLTEAGERSVSGVFEEERWAKGKLGGEKKLPHPIFFLWGLPE
jgi:hypothetical protein